MRAHCINTAHGDLWLSQDVPGDGERGVFLSVSTHDMAGTEYDLTLTQARDLRDACEAFLREYAPAFAVTSSRKEGGS